MEENIETTETDITEEFLKEYEKLRRKYKRDFAVEVRLNPEKVNIP